MIKINMNVFFYLIFTARFHNGIRFLDFKQFTLTNNSIKFDFDSYNDAMQTPKMMETVLCLKINQYIEDIEYEPNKSIKYLISKIRTKSKCTLHFDALIIFFISRGTLDLINIDIHANLNGYNWIEKLLFLYLYYAYDFLYDCKLVIPYTYANCEKTFEFKLIMSLKKILILKDEKSVVNIILTLIQHQYIKNKLTVKELIDIERNNIAPSKDFFIPVLKIFILKLIELICTKVEIKNNIVLNKFKSFDEANIINLLDKTIKEYPNFEVIWKNSRKNNCMQKGAFKNVQNIRHILLIFETLLECIDIDDESCTILIYDIDIIKNIIDYLIFKVCMLSKISTNFSKKLTLELFGFFYGTSNELIKLSFCLSMVEYKFLNYMKNKMKSCDKQSYVYFSILKIKEDFDINESCNQIFVKYRNELQKVYKYKKEIIEIIIMFYHEYDKTIANIFKLLNDTICCYREISKSEFSEETNKTTQNVYEEIINKKIFKKKTNRTSNKFMDVIIHDQQSWYMQHKTEFKDNNLMPNIHAYIYYLNHQCKVENNSDVKKSEFIIDMRM